MVHGWAKWNRGPAAFAELLKLAHVPLPLANAWLVTLLEIFGGLALLMGAFVAIVSIPLILSMTFCLLSTAGRGWRNPPDYRGDISSQGGTPGISARVPRPQPGQARPTS